MKLELEIPDEVIGEFAARVAELVVAQLDARKPPLITVDEAAELLQCKPQRVYDLQTQGRLSRRKDGARTLVVRAEVEAHLRGEAVGPIAQRLPSASRARPSCRVAA